MVGAVGEMASMKRRKLWKTGEDGLCCSSSAIQTLLGPSSLLEERSEIPLFLFVPSCCRLPSKLGETAKVYRWTTSKREGFRIICDALFTFFVFLVGSYFSFSYSR